MPNGGWRIVAKQLQTYGFEVDPTLEKIFTEYRKTHNAGVFDAYPPAVRAGRRSHIITGLPSVTRNGGSSMPATAARVALQAPAARTIASASSSTPELVTTATPEPLLVRDTT